ncbi:hypothetical protein [Enterococcus viikkiensis]|uniref:hypothetical protein n=1 Tax=Enterococcus viikkiensis TaxID=930854 RepID=UPI0010F872AF|nr:hypothetical protein [Enterococcus viikkiensis]
MNKQIKPKDEYSNREKIIIQGTKKMLENQVKQVSYSRLFFSSIRFISWKLWCVQFVLVGLSLGVLISKRMDFELVLKGLTGLVLFSVIFFADEVFKSYTTRMWELEQTFKYDLKQHTAMKLLAFGIFDLLFIFFLALTAGHFFSGSFFQFALFLLAPYNVFCIVLFSVFTLFRNRLTNMVLWSASGILVAAAIIVSSLVNIYQVPLLYWGIVYSLTLIGLIGLIKKMLEITREGSFYEVEN